MVSFLRRVFGGNDKKPGGSPSQAEPGDAASAEPLDVARITEIIRYFPLGSKIRYYPEYQKEGALDTLVLGYGINDHLVYSAIDIRCQQQGGRDVLRLMVDGQEHLVGELKNFCLLIPFNRDDENKRDYVRRAELGPRGPFRRHNVITLMACSSGGILSHLDTVVRRIQPLKEGIYAGHEVVMLDVIPSTLTLTDQRQHYRLHTELPVTLVVKDGDTHECTLMDFSEESVQLRFPASNEDLASLTEYRHLTLNIDVSTGSQAKRYALDGVMYRKTDASLVMKLLGIYRGDGGKAEPLGLVDILDIKAGLLQHPATQQALAKHRAG